LGILLVVRKIFPPKTRMHRNPLLSISIYFLGMGMQSIMLGLLAELLMRTYHESQDKTTYVVRSVTPTRSTETSTNGDISVERVVLGTM
jgi:hypothetical protein